MCDGPAFVHDAHVNDADTPRILLGNLEPMMLIGLRRVLAEEGMLVVGEEQAADQILDEAERLQPDIIVLDLDSTHGAQLTEDVRSVAPTAKLIFWARDETLMEVLDPSARNARVVAPTAPEELRGELTARK